MLLWQEWGLLEQQLQGGTAVQQQTSADSALPTLKRVLHDAKATRAKAAVCIPYIDRRIDATSLCNC
jgi:hypothetical protein